MNQHVLLAAGAVAAFAIVSNRDDGSGESSGSNNSGSSTPTSSTSGSSSSDGGYTYSANSPDYGSDTSDDPIARESDDTDGDGFVNTGTITGDPFTDVAVGTDTSEIPDSYWTRGGLGGPG